MSLEALCKSIIGTANSMGIEIVKDLWEAWLDKSGRILWHLRVPSFEFVLEG
jgi:hypothetical protein